MKSYKIVLFFFAAIFAPIAAPALTITVGPLSAPDAFHPVFTAGVVSSFTTDVPTSTTFDVEVGVSYSVTAIIMGVPTVVGTVTFDAGGNPTFTPSP